MAEIRRSVRSTAVSLGAALMALLCGTPVAFAQAQERSSINGTVTADKGEVRGFRVRAHNLDRMIWYTVFTKNGSYNVPQALAGKYEVSVLQDGYTSPQKTIDLRAGQTQTIDLALTKDGER